MNILVAIVVVLVITFAAYYWYYNKHTVKITLAGLSAAQDTSVNFTGTTSSAVDISELIGKKVRLTTKSLGTISSAVVGVSILNGVLSIHTATGAYTGSKMANLDPSDRAYVYI